jgi:lipoprotein NlpD
VADKPSERKPEPAAVSDGSLKWAWPTKGKVVQTFVAGDRTRQGIRIAGTAGQPILAAEAGKVVYTGSGLPGYGKLIIVKHNKNYLSAYGFNRKLLVKDGDQVARGARVAEMGQSTDGKTMLHFEIRRRDKPLDPLKRLPR